MRTDPRLVRLKILNGPHLSFIDAPSFNPFRFALCPRRLTIDNVTQTRLRSNETNNSFPADIVKSMKGSLVETQDGTAFARPGTCQCNQSKTAATQLAIATRQTKLRTDKEDENTCSRNAASKTIKMANEKTAWKIHNLPYTSSWSTPDAPIGQRHR